jgi:hypothetical protein
MFKPICFAVALALAPAGAALAHGTHHHHHAKHARTNAAGDASVIDRCSDLHYGAKVACLSSARAGAPSAMGTGGTMETAGGTMSMSVAPYDLALNTPAQSSRHVDAKPVEDLEAAAQRLRDAVHALAQAPAGEKRNDAIHEANKTLMEVQNAIAALPPGVVTAAGNESNYKAAMDRLEMASQRLRDASHALAREPVGSKRADAMKTINKALVDTQQVMLDLPLTRIQ